ncbi:hypothetical protein MSAN_02389100 [Mycena sanguinolenta]|uniref:F-box domain-containing protein n=1 Tax=Mycena sanguinolenta TaxID=230812 RepID=A0A8H6X4E3_9AGAR|nr:hypothetical protein MSAN_02389100 [Mycena sanguinolenta]
MPLANISDLPTEILAKILEDVPSETLCSLASLSRRLNYALSLYFSRSNLDLKDVTITLVPNRHDPLSAFQICLSISSMQRVEIIFPHPSCSTIFPFLKQMKRVENFFSRLTSVKEVVLQLDNTGSIRCLAPGSDEALRAWATRLGALLTCIVEKGCTALTVVNGTHLIEAYQLQLPKFSAKYLPRLLRKVLLPQNARSLGFRRNPRQGTADVSSAMPRFPAHSLQLNTLHIETATLVMPPGLHWTLTALHQCPITSLGIRMSLVESHIWSVVLPSIVAACPNLTSLRLTDLDSYSRSHEASTETLALAFLAHFPRLVDLELTHLWGSGMYFDWRSYLFKAKGPTAPLKHLTRLRAPPSIVSHLLSRPFALPIINSICILWKEPSSPDYKTLVRFLSSIFRVLSWRRLTPELSLWIESLSRAAEGMAILRGLSAPPLEQLARVERLHLEYAFLGTDLTQPLLEPVVAAFRGLKQLSVTTRSGDAAVAILAQVAWATDSLKSVEINGKSYDLASRSPGVHSHSK